MAQTDQDRAVELEKIAEEIWKLYQGSEGVENLEEIDDAVNTLYAAFKVDTVVCSVCFRDVPERTAHYHQHKWIGDLCCWDERLRSSE
jgi:hypothetical protein